MPRRKPLISQMPVAVILCFAIGALTVRLTAQETNSANTATQDQNQAADTRKTASDDKAKAPASDLKSAATDEGQLATVNNAKIPSDSKAHGAPLAGGFESSTL